MNKRPLLPDVYGRDSMTLVSHGLCPYVQRAAIVALEKDIALERVVVDLANKPDWFVERSPTGKVPLLMVGEVTLFESAAIAEFLDEISDGSMLPADPVQRARHRAWIEYASGTLAEIGALYSANDSEGFENRCTLLTLRFRRIAAELGGSWFGGEEFGIVDAAFAPVFRYLDAFEHYAGLFLLPDLSNLAAWRHRLSLRPSVIAAVSPEYPERLRQFLVARNSHISQRMFEFASTHGEMAN